MSHFHLPALREFKTYLKSKGAILCQNGWAAAPHILREAYELGSIDVWDVTHGMTVHSMSALRALEAAGMVKYTLNAHPAEIHITDEAMKLIEGWGLIIED